MHKLLKYVTALLALALIIAVSVFGTGAALWIAFGTAIAMTLVAGADLAVSAGRRDPLSSTAAAGTLVLAAFLIVATLIFEGVSMSWLLAIAGGTIELLALGVPVRSEAERAAEVAAPQAAGPGVREAA